MGNSEAGIRRNLQAASRHAGTDYTDGDTGALGSGGLREAGGRRGEGGEVPKTAASDCCSGFAHRSTQGGEVAARCLLAHAPGSSQHKPRGG